MAKEKIPKNKEWLELCEWLEINIFNYDIPNQRLQTPACLVLMGLTKGQDVANNNNRTNGLYSYDIILMTFKANKMHILKSIRNKTFNSERQKMQYICAIVKDKINDIYSRYKAAQKAKEKVEEVNLDIATNTGAEYVKKESKINKRLDDLW